MKQINLILFLSLIFIGFSCKKNKTEDPPDLGYDYAPTTLGKYVVYDVDSTVYDDFMKDTTYYKYRIKEKLVENLTDNEGRPAIKLIRYIKKYNASVSYDNIPWTIKDVWTYTKTKATLEVVEEDVRFTKLIFPVKTDATWNGNAKNSLGELNYKYLSVDMPQIINGVKFDNVLVVEQKDDKGKNAIRRQYFVEKHAKNVGLIYREIKDLYSNTIVINKPVEQRIEKGVVYKQMYVSHGIE